MKLRVAHMLNDNWALFTRLDFTALATELNRLDGKPAVTLAEVESHVAQDGMCEWLQSSFATQTPQAYRSLAWLSDQVLAPSRALYEAAVLMLARFIG
jgi:hypothetical protein